MKLFDVMRAAALVLLVLLAVPLAGCQETSAGPINIGSSCDGGLR